MEQSKTLQSQRDVVCIPVRNLLHVIDGDSFLSIINSVIANDVSDLELQRVSIEGQWQALRKLERDELRARVKLSMYASVTSVIPFMNYPCKTSGYIVGRCDKAIEKFAFDHAKSTTFDTCNSVWKMMSIAISR